MKFFIPILLLTVLLISCNSSEVFEVSGENADSLIVSETITLPKPSMGDFSNPKFSTDNSKLFFTSAGFNGIWYYNLNDSSMEQFSSQNGTGYNFVFSEDGSKIYYQLPASTVSNGEEKYSLVEQDINTGKINVLHTSGDKFTQLKYLSGNKIFYIQKNKPQILDVKNKQLDKSADISSKIIFYETTRVKRYYKGKEKNIVTSEENIIWMEENPVNDKILFYTIGKGAVIADSSGAVETLGDFRAAKWSPDGSFIVYMIDEDDGHRVTASDIYVYSIKTGKSFNITATKDVIEMNPVWSDDGNMIAYNTLDGFIKIAKIKYE